MRLLSLKQVFDLHRKILAQSGGQGGVLDQGGLESSVAQPGMTFDGQDLYPRLVDKAAALGYSIINNHPFIDGNKRTGHAAMEVTLLLNGYEIKADVHEQEKVILAVASGVMSREGFVAWLTGHLVEVSYE